MTMRKGPRVATVAALVVLGALALWISQGRAQTEADRQPAANTAGSNYLSIQGRLTDARGRPLDRQYALTPRPCADRDDEVALCEEAPPPRLRMGCSRPTRGPAYARIDGRALYLGIQGEDDPEMTPRCYIDNVPCAWGRRPGARAVTSDTTSLPSRVNTGDGYGLFAQSAGSAGLYAATRSGLASFAHGPIASSATS